MSRERTAITFTLAAALCVVAAGCSQPGTSGSGGTSGGGTVTVALAEAPDALDPTVAATYVGRIVFANMCEKLYDVGEGLEIVPQLASDLPEVSADGKTYTIPLREATFNDGTTFDAEAVKTTLEHYIEAPKSARSAELASVKSVEAVDDHTVKVELKAPYAPFTSILADRSGMILSPTQLKKLGDDFADDPVCVGPFEFKDRPSSDQIELTKSEDYYDADQVKLDGVKFLAVTQPNVRAANLRSGDVDIADRVAVPDVETLQDEQGVELEPVTSLGYQGITINVSNTSGAGTPSDRPADNPLASSPELREAFALSLDRDTINDVVYQGQYVPGCTPISPDSPYAPDIECPEQDLDRARQLVEKSGVPTPIPLELVVEAANSESAKLGTVIQSMAKEAGFDVKVRPTEFTTALDQAAQGDFTTFQVGWSGRLDPDQNIAPFWDPTSALNYSGANYADVQDLIEQERATTDEAKRRDIFQQLAESFLEHNNIIYLYHPQVVMGRRTAVTGIDYFGDGLIRLKNASVSGG